MVKYEYTRGEGERFLMTENGIEFSVRKDDGQLMHIARSMPVDAFTMAATALDLSLAGWQPVTDD